MKGWQKLNLEKCISKVKYPLKISRRDFLGEGLIPIVSQEKELINGFWDDESDIFRINKPVVIFGDHTRNLKYIDFDFVLGADGVKILEPKDEIESKYLFYFLMSCPVENIGYARHYRLLKKVNVLFPESIAEQKWIVAILDEAFEGIDSAIANTKKNLANAHDLFESYLSAIFIQKENGWAEKKLQDVCQRITVGHVGSMKSEYQEDGVPFLRSQNILPFAVNLEKVAFIGQDFHNSLKKSKLKPGDVAIVRTGYPGTAAVIPESLPDSNCSDLVIITPGSAINPHYLCLFFNSAFGKSMVSGNLVGAAQKHFNVTAAKNVDLPCPPIAQQEQLVSMCDEFSTATKRLEAIYKQKLAALNELKQSILQKAFIGELTTDVGDPIIEAAKESVAA